MTIKITEAELWEVNDSHGGWCVECGEEASGVEPDAMGYACESCGAHAVMGAENAVIMGHVEISD